MYRIAFVQQSGSCTSIEWVTVENCQQMYRSYETLSNDNRTLAMAAFDEARKLVKFDRFAGTYTPEYLAGRIGW